MITIFSSRELQIESLIRSIQRSTINYNTISFMYVYIYWMHYKIKVCVFPTIYFYDFRTNNIYNSISDLVEITEFNS